MRVTGLDLMDRGLSGTIPDALGRLSMLTHLNLRTNPGLSGEIPDALGNLRNLRLLNLHSNSHTGAVPDLRRITGLEELYLANNADYVTNDDGKKVKIEGTGLTGQIPTWLNGMTNMEELWLWGNSLTGTVPNLSGMTSLDKLKLANNNLTGGVPQASTLPPNMTWLIIDRNPFGGTIPNLSSLSRLRLLWLHSNELTGSVPTDDMLPASLDDLNLRDNMLTGGIPDLSDLDMLTRLRLHNNSLSGEVPATLGDLDSLKQLWLHNEDATKTDNGNNSFTSIAAGVGRVGRHADRDRPRRQPVECQCLRAGGAGERGEERLHGRWHRGLLSQRRVVEAESTARAGDPGPRKGQASKWQRRRVNRRRWSFP